MNNSGGPTAEELLHTLISSYNFSMTNIDQDIKNILNLFGSYKIKTYYVRGYDPSDNTIFVSDYKNTTDPKAEGIKTNNPMSLAGISGKGVHAFPRDGSRVYCVRSDTEQVTICLGVVPEPSKAAGNSNEQSDASGETSYPDMKKIPNGIVVQDDAKSEIELDGEGGIEITTSQGLGLKIYSFASDDSVSYNINSNINNHSRGKSERSGFMMRLENDNPELITIPESSQSSLYINNLVHELGGSDLITGVFPKSSYVDLPNNSRLKNLARTETRSVYNHMERGFRGWDLYDSDSKREDELLYANLTESQQLEMKHIFLGFNALNMAPNQIVEVVSGNVSKNKIPLDINYLPIVIGDQNTDPTSKSRKDMIKEAENLDKRGIAHHFQVNTRTKIEEECTYNKNFVFSVDKQGVFRLNVPKSNEFGNIPFPVSCDYYSKGFGINSFPKSNVPARTKIPIVRQISKDQYLPAISSLYRKTGIRYYGLRNKSGKHSGFSDENISYADNGGGERVNLTMYHNMWACAERSIANSLSVIDPVNIGNIEDKNPLYKDARNKPAMVSKKDLKRSGKKPVSGYSVVEVTSKKPAIHHGGDVPYGGRSLRETGGRAYSNDFEVDGSDPKRTPATEDPSGISGNINFEGSLISSFGRDSKDGKSLLMDCAGSMISWFGVDNQGRSIVTQTDGAVIMEIGNPDNVDKATNIKEGQNGSLYLRVNVTKKGTVGAPEDNNKGEGDDYVISISDQGLVIWGANPEKPMIFRNAGDINLESTRGSIYLSSAGKIFHKEGVKKFNDLRSKTVVPAKSENS